MANEEEKFMNNEDEGQEDNNSNLKSTANTSELKKKKYYKCYTTMQIKRMKEVFKKTPHPDEEELKEIGMELGLRPVQVKFWFQNRRSQIKRKSEEDLNRELKEQNEKLRADNELYKLMLASAACQNCGAPMPGATLARVELLKAENLHLKEKIFMAKSLMEKYCGRGVFSFGMNSTSLSPST